MVRLRLVLRGVSPLIVCTIEVPDAATLAVFNEAMLVLFGWSGEHLHEFTIRSVGYSSDWAVDAEDSRKMNLEGLGLRFGERFCWARDFFAGWIVDIRVEAITATMGRRSSVCPVDVPGHRNGAAARTVSERGRTLTACPNTPSA